MGFFLVFLFILAMCPPFSFRSLKLSLSSSSPDVFFLPSLDSPCYDSKIINQSEAKWPYLAVSPPWEKYSTSRLFSSDCFLNRLEKLKSRPLEHPNNVTYKMLIDTLIQRNCSLYIHGGIIRDIMQGVSDPHDLDSEFSCEPTKLLEILNDFLGPNNFYYNLSSEFFHIDKRTAGMDAFYWDIAFFDLDSQEYTPNSLYFDTFNNLLIDLSGYGVEDAVHKQMRIPVERADWDLWLFKTNQGEYFKRKFLRKIPRFWKLKASGYKSADNATQPYLMNVIENLWEDPNFEVKDVFFEYVCIMTESSYNNMEFKCNGHSYTDKSREFCKNLMIELKNDFSKSTPLVKKDMINFVDNFDCFVEQLHIYIISFLILFAMIMYF